MACREGMTSEGRAYGCVQEYRDGHCCPATNPTFPSYLGDVGPRRMWVTRSWVGISVLHWIQGLWEGFLLCLLIIFLWLSGPHCRTRMPCASSWHNPYFLYPRNESSCGFSPSSPRLPQCLPQIPSLGGQAQAK